MALAPASSPAMTSARRFLVPAGCPSVVISAAWIWLNALTTFEAGRCACSSSDVVVVQCNINDPAERRSLTQRLHREISDALGISCVIELVPRHTLPRTSSGKLSRSAAREDYLQRRAQERKATRPDEFGFDTADAGPLKEGWRIQRDTPGYGPRRTAEELRRDLAAAERCAAA